jgi:hypothetical protein
VAGDRGLNAVQSTATVETVTAIEDEKLGRRAHLDPIFTAFNPSEEGGIAIRSNGPIIAPAVRQGQADKSITSALPGQESISGDGIGGENSVSKGERIAARHRIELSKYCILPVFPPLRASAQCLLCCEQHYAGKASTGRVSTTCRSRRQTVVGGRRIIALAS